MLGGIGLLTRDVLASCLHLPALTGSGLLQTFRVAHSCGAVADFHRASRSSHQWILAFAIYAIVKTQFLSAPKFLP
jgi:hypothetical protein